MADDTTATDTSTSLRAPDWAHPSDVTTCGDGTLYQVPRSRTLKGVDAAHVDELLTHGYTRDTTTSTSADTTDTAGAATGETATAKKGG